MRSASAPGLAALLVVASSVGLGACASAPTDVVEGRLRECGILSAGEVGPYTLSGIYAPDDCYARCLAAASCEALEASVCRTELELLLTCDAQCAFPCDDGILIGPERVCDGFAQCMDGTDEAGCDYPLACDDGTRRPGARCDGSWNCADGSDERDCPGSSGRQIACGDGSGFYYDWYRCDGSRSCANGADEVGCPTYVCADARVLTYRENGISPRCDGYAQCWDGSDEAGCALLQPQCSP